MKANCKHQYELVNSIIYPSSGYYPEWRFTCGHCVDAIHIWYDCEDNFLHIHQAADENYLTNLIHYNNVIVYEM